MTTELSSIAYDHYEFNKPLPRDFFPDLIEYLNEVEEIQKTALKTMKMFGIAVKKCGGQLTISKQDFEDIEGKSMSRQDISSMKTQYTLSE